MFFFKGSKEVAKNSIIRNAMSIVTGEDWKRIRSRVTPAFTTGKIKRVIPYFNKSTYDLVHVIERHVDQGKALPLKDLMSRLALDVIGRGGFSLEMNSFDQNSDSVFFNNARNIFNDKWFLLKASLMQFCPALAEQIENFTGIDLMEQELHRYFKAFLLNLYETRKAEHGSKNYNDILELLMEVCDEEDKQLTSQTMAEDSDIIHKELSQSSKHISKIELISQGFILLLAGYETTGSTLHLIIFILAALQDVQDKLREEIANVVGDEEEITYEHTKQFDYMNKVIYETLRMYPAAVKTNRECNNEIEINGIFFKEGDVVTILLLLFTTTRNSTPTLELLIRKDFPLKKKQVRSTHICRICHFSQKFRFKPAPNSPKLPINSLLYSF
uniref:Cytochrome P450 n=1 Tax=Ditylenchus dipsaci TaxID=166011 RepID=A0A915DZD5_9BILA